MSNLLALLLLLGVPVFACAGPPSAPAPKPIQDNSFLIEEAYNQERGVVQHINTFQRFHSGDWVYTFTQEWPVPDQQHQLSFTLPVVRMDDHRGVGDLALNYRYQLVGDSDARVALAPRFSVLLPTGDFEEALGAGGVGLQGLLPVSVVLHPQLVTHWNVGVTFTPGAKNPAGVRTTRPISPLGRASSGWCTPGSTCSSRRCGPAKSPLKIAIQRRAGRRCSSILASVGRTISPMGCRSCLAWPFPSGLAHRAASGVCSSI